MNKQAFLGKLPGLDEEVLDQMIDDVYNRDEIMDALSKPVIIIWTSDGGDLVVNGHETLEQAVEDAKGVLDDAIAGNSYAFNNGWILVDGKYRRLTENITVSYSVILE
jgi:hypothetical protein